MKKIDLDFYKGMSKKSKIIGSILFLLILTYVLFFIIFFATKTHSSIKLQSVKAVSVKALKAYDNSARTGLIKEAEYANFGFSQLQKTFFSSLYDDEGTAALTIRVKIFPTEAQKNKITTSDIFRFGFLTEEDFNSRGKFIKQKYAVNNKIEIQARENDFSGILDISLAISKDSDFERNIPEGFYIFSSQRCKIISACVSPAFVGFDKSLEIPFYGFSYNGGKIDFNNSNFDFSGSQMVFSGENSSTTQLPQYVIQFSKRTEYKSTSENLQKVEVNIGGEKYFLNNVACGECVTIPAGALKNPFGRVEIIKNDEFIDSIIMKNVKNLEKGKRPLIPVKTDPGLILNYKQSSWRNVDYEIFEWDRFPGILFFDTRDYDIQNKFFTRLAFFVEKEGFKGRLLSDDELAGKHGYNAHDYSSESMAKFFNKAYETGFKLNEYELLLKEILIKNGLFEIDGNLVKPLDGGLVSISRECPDWSRINLLAHEGWHTIFFRDEEFRNFVSAVYYTIDPASLEFLIQYFKSQPSLGYDVNDEYLMHNEFMAYIMQQKINQVADYFVHLANRGTVIKFTPELASYIRKTQGIAFEDAATALNDYVFDRYGIVCGNIALVNRY